ncbi:MAG: S24/S26 family peptidase, partial [Ruminococcus sp.]|nr:S24/S26 family peptidase [Ruminococcus sp.]
DLVLEKHRLRRYGERFSTVITALSWAIGGLSLAALFVCIDLHVIELMDMQSIPTDISRSTALGIAWQLSVVSVFDSWFGGQYYYFLLAVSLPLTAMLLLNSIEMKVHTRRLCVKYPTEFAEESNRKSRVLWLVSGIAAFLVLAGAVTGVLKLSGVLQHYETVEVITDSMSPTLQSGDTVSVCTDIDAEHLERGSIILFHTTDGMQMLGRISRVNYDDDWNAVSYKVVQDDPDNTDRWLVYPQNVIGVWKDAPMPESSDEYDFGY